MAPIKFIAMEVDGKKHTIEIDDTKTVYDLAEAISKISNIKIEDFELRVRESRDVLSKDQDKFIKDVEKLTGGDDPRYHILILLRPKTKKFLAREDIPCGGKRRGKSKKTRKSKKSRRQTKKRR